MEIVRSRYVYNQVKQPPQKQGRKFIKGVILFVLFILVAYVFTSLTKEVPAVAAQITLSEAASQQQPVDLDWPAAGQAAIGDYEDGLLAKSSNDEQKKPIASMAKVITALAVLDKKPLNPGEQGEIYTVTAADIEIYNQYVAKQGSVLPVKAGQKLTQYQMLQAILLPSANNVADYLATWVFGSQAAYIDYANNMTKAWGLENTDVADASGFSPLTASTPSGMIVVGQKALANPVVAEIVATKQAVIPESGIIKNTNQLLNDTNVVGIKTGTTDEAGNCLLFAVKHGPELSETLVAVVMGQPNWNAAYSSSRILRDSALQHFGMVEVLPADTVVGKYSTPWGQSTDIVNKQTLGIYGWKSKVETVGLDIETVNVPVNAGEVVGRAFIDKKEVSVDLVTSSNLESPGIIWRLTNYR